MRFHLMAIGAACIAALSAAGPAAAAATAKKASCPAKPVLPPELSGWARSSSNKTIYGYGDARAADWPPLAAARTGLALHRYESLSYWIAPARAPDPFKFGGMVPIVVKQPGRLTVALDEGAWIDLVRDGKIVRSVSHDHGPACSGIRKMVDFDVTEGRYLLQIVNAPNASIRAMAVVR
ncbi:hypothetical protein GCM10009115_06270 [Sphingopyxis soli]|uniref:Homogentisate 1,2-dioxygenase n=1 Tax=Sphingopyxis soli TaxID=592051 RepID=A0ABP3X877_9SPHN|nr:homogentisate 1,2-dioxygenase [Sphingopyxis soli]